MLPPVVCNCGLPIGDIARVFIQKRNELIKKELNEELKELKESSKKIDPNNLMYLNSKASNLNLDPLFKELGNPPLCCRIQLSTNMLFADYY